MLLNIKRKMIINDLAFCFEDNFINFPFFLSWSFIYLLYRFRFRKRLQSLDMIKVSYLKSRRRRRRRREKWLVRRRKRSRSILFFFKINLIKYILFNGIFGSLNKSHGMYNFFLYFALYLL